MAACVNGSNNGMHPTPTLGLLERVTLREVWKNEASHFTPWLAQLENLKILADTLNLELELEAQEKNVGAFRADILCKSTEDSSWVLIENQLERTDHTHLGQLLTYATGLQAVTIVWIAESFTEEHRAVLDWLNDITDNQYRFFGLEIELWRIADSPPAPKFNIVSKPNDWTRSISKAAQRISTTSLNDTQRIQLEFWSKFKEHLEDSESRIRARDPIPEGWLEYPIGKTGFYLITAINTRDSKLVVKLVIYDQIYRRAYFSLLYEDKEQIEREVGSSLEWRELSSTFRILIEKDVEDVSNKNNWPEYINWIGNMLEKFDNVFRGRILKLDPLSWQPDEDEDAV